MNRRLTFASAAFVTMFLWQCVPSSGIIGPAGFSHPVYHYNVAYGDRAQKVFVGPDWQLDNYYRVGESYKPKEGNNYWAVREFDLDGNGEVSSAEKNDEPIYDLRFVNGKDDGIIWIKAHPVDMVDSKRDLEVVLDNYADSLGGTGLYAQGNLFSIKRTKARAYTTFVTAKERTHIGSREAITGKIEIAEVEKLRLDSSYRSEKIKVVFVRFFFQEAAPRTMGREPVNPAGWPAHKDDDGLWTFDRPALLVVGYANSVAKFDQHEKEFDGVLKQLAIDTIESPPSQASSGSASAPSGSAPSPPRPAGSAPTPPASASARPIAQLRSAAY